MLIRKVALSLAGGLVLFTVALSFLAIRRYWFIKRFESIQPGNSKVMVLDKLGAPAETFVCGDPQATDELNRRCRIELWYYSFLERWVVYLDEKDAVIHTSHAVSY